MVRGSSWCDGVSYLRPQWVRASAPAWCSPRGPRGVDFFLQGLFTCLRGFIAFAEPVSASSGRWVSVWLQEEPPSLCAEQEGDQEFPCLFCTALAHPFRSEGGVVCRALECEPRSLGLDLVAGRAPEPPHGARGRSGVSLSFLCDPRASFLFRRRGGGCQATLGEREQWHLR